MNKNCTFKNVFLSTLFIFFCAFVSHANIAVSSVFLTSEVDNLDGTCTYGVSIVFANTTTAVTADLSVNIGTISNCNGGGCTGTSVSAGAIVPVTITKGCGDVVKITLKGYNSVGTFCGEGVAVFTGLEPLPAELIAFNATQESRTNTLFWETASEENTLIFQVQRSLDGLNDFQSIGRVTASINSSTVKSYEFVDKDPLSLAYYRLQIIDRDGSFDFSEVIVVQRAKTDITLVEVFPVPAINNEVTVLVHSKKEGPVFLDLFDMTGRIIMQDRIELQEGINRLLVDWESNEGNVYFFTLYNGTERISQKIVKSNMD